MSKQEVGSCVSELGLPEVDRILQASVFSRNTINSFPVQQVQELLISKFQRQLEIPSCECSRQRTNSSVSMDKNTTDGGLDYINQLPHDILLFIISRLTTKEGAATSILSRRWRYLWTASISVLNFDLTNKVGYDYLTDDEAQRHLRINENFLWEERFKFTTWLNRVLHQIQSCPRTSSINALRIAFVLGKESASSINQWIQYAANNGLTQLELDFSLRLRIGLSTRVAYDFPFQLFASTSLNYLRLHCVNFNLPPDFKGFNSLKSLTLKNSFLTLDSLHNILSNCSFLECLSLLYCHFHGFPDELKFSGPSLRLKHLRLLLWVEDSIKKIELHDVNIISFEFNGICTKLLIKNAPRLARLVLCTETPVDILSKVSLVEALFMATWSRTTESILPNLYAFNNLKRLVFIANDNAANLLHVIYILETCPSLQKLELDMGILNKERTENLTQIATRPVIPYMNLKEIEIYGFQGHLEKIELVKCLLVNAVVLEEMKIFTTSRKYLGNGEWTLYEGTVKQTRSLSEVWKLLQKEVRSSTELKFVVPFSWQNDLYK